MDARERVACVAAALLLLGYGVAGDYEHPELVHLGALLVGALALGGAFARRRWAAYAALACALLVGIHERLLNVPFNGNDVMLATDEAVGVLLAGGNPYAHAYAATNPPGQPFAYPPGELLFYTLGKLGAGNIFGLDRWAGIANLVLLAALAPVVGCALAALAVTLAALAGQLAFTAVNGSNDTAASFLALLAIVLLAGALRGRAMPSRILWWTSAVAFGWAIVFKETTVLVYGTVLAYLIRERDDWRGYALGSLVPAAAVTLPFVVWNPLGFWRNVVAGLLVHANVWGRNVWAILSAIAPDARDAIVRFIPSIMLAAWWVGVYLCWRFPARGLGGAVLQGCALLGVLFVFGRWTTWTYYVQVAPLLLAGAALALAQDDEGVRA